MMLDIIIIASIYRMSRIMQSSDGINIISLQSLIDCGCFPLTIQCIQKPLPLESTNCKVVAIMDIIQPTVNQWHFLSVKPSMKKKLWWIDKQNGNRKHALYCDKPIRSPRKFLINIETSWYLVIMNESISKNFWARKK